MNKAKSIWLPLGISSLFIILLFFIFSINEDSIVFFLQDMHEEPIRFSIFSFLLLASDIVLPVPSSIVMYLNGYFLGCAVGSIMSLISLLLSSIIGYYIGKLTSFGLKSRSEKDANATLTKYGMLSILITRGIPILSESLCIVCGYNKLPFKQFFIFNLIGYVPLCLLYAICGSFGYDNNIFFISFGCSLLISVAFVLLGKKFLKINLKASKD